MHGLDCHLLERKLFVQSPCLTTLYGHLVTNFLRRSSVMRILLFDSEIEHVTMRRQNKAERSEFTFYYPMCLQILDNILITHTRERAHTSEAL